MLPTELQVIIFDLAFARSADVTPIDKVQWRDRERLKKRQRPSGADYVKRPFPGPKVSELMVSKQFFDLAARSYVQSQWVEYSHACFSHRDENNIFVKYAEDIVADVFQLELLKYHFVNLRKLAVKMSRTGFCVHATYSRAGNDDDSLSDEDASDDEPVEDKWNRLETSLIEERLQSEDFATCGELNRLFEGFKGLAEFRLIDDDHFSYTSPTNKMKWQANLKAYEEYVWQTIISKMSADREVNAGRTSEKALALVAHKPRSSTARSPHPWLAVEPLPPYPRATSASALPLAAPCAQIDLAQPSALSRVIMTDQAEVGHGNTSVSMDASDRIRKRFAEDGDPWTSPKRLRYDQAVTSLKYDPAVASRPETQDSTFPPGLHGDFGKPRSAVSSSSAPLTGTKSTLGSASSPYTQGLPELQVSFRLGAVLLQLEHRLEAGDVALRAWVADMKTRFEL